MIKMQRIIWKPQFIMLFVVAMIIMKNIANEIRIKNSFLIC